MLIDLHVYVNIVIYKILDNSRTTNDLVVRVLTDGRMKGQTGLILYRTMFKHTFDILGHLVKSRPSDFLQMIQ